MQRITWMGAVALAAALPGAAFAQAAEPLEEGEVISLADWSYDALYEDGWSAEELLDADVHGPEGDEIGEVENLVIGADGKLLSLIAEVGGFWDIADTHVSVPWSKVELTEGFEEVAIPVTEENLKDYSVFQDWRVSAQEARGSIQEVDDDLLTGPRAWRATELIDDYAVLEDRLEYGYVDDLIFNAAGELQAVVVRPDVAYGTPGVYAYPYYGYDYGWEPGLDYYELPYGEGEIGDLEPLDYDEL